MKEVQTAFLSYDYDEDKDDIAEVFNVNKSSIEHLMLNMALNKELTYTRALISALQEQRIQGNELMFLACMGMKHIMQKGKVAPNIGMIPLEPGVALGIGGVGIIPGNLSKILYPALKEMIESFTPEIKERLLNELPEDIKKKLGFEE